MEILLIAGPASVALDRARILANFSTGKTGVVLAETLRKHRFHITLWYGTGATYPPPACTPPNGSRPSMTLKNLSKRRISKGTGRFSCPPPCPITISLPPMTWLATNCPATSGPGIFRAFVLS